MTRCGQVALIGPPNAGKSTLINALVGSKIAIVSRKVQTTRLRVRGIVIRDETQIIFVDTPGIFEPRRMLDRAMVTSAWAEAGDADAIALLVDAAKGLDEEARAIIERLNASRRKALLLLNKIDLVPRASLLELAAAFDASGAFERIFMISGLKSDGVEDFVNELDRRMPEGPWLYPEDQAADLPQRVLAAEITREAIYDRLHDELPYQTTVETERWTELKDGSVRIEQTIHVARESQRPIVIGKGGQTIKALSQAARGELEAMLERKVHLFLHVKLTENWAEDPERFRDMGLDLPPRE